MGILGSGALLCGCGAPETPSPSRAEARPGRQRDAHPAPKGVVGLSRRRIIMRDLFSGGEDDHGAKTDFTPDEWKLLLQSPLIAGIAVSAADPSGLIGMMKESMASPRALLQAKADPNADALVKAVAGDFETSEGRGLAQDAVKTTIAGSAKPADIVAKALQALSAVSALLASKAPADAAAFKTWLAGVAKTVWEAAPEGGFLGFGGTQVSDAEKATVAQIAPALGVPPPAM